MRSRAPSRVEVKGTALTGTLASQPLYPDWPRRAGPTQGYCEEIRKDGRVAARGLANGRNRGCKRAVSFTWHFLGGQWRHH